MVSSGTVSNGKRLKVVLETKNKRLSMRPFVIIDDDEGTLKIFDSKSMKKMRYSIKLRNFTVDKVKALAPDAEAQHFRVRLQVHHSIFEFIFEDAAEWMDFKNVTMRYLKGTDQIGKGKESVF